MAHGLPKNGPKHEAPKAGRKIHPNLILGLNGAAKSHFGPILGPLGCQYTFLGFKNGDSGLRSTVFASISSPLFPTPANLERKWPTDCPKNGQKRGVPEAGRKIHQSLIFGLNGAAKSHFGPILGPVGCQYSFLGFKNVDSGLRCTVCVDLSPLFQKNGERFPTQQLT